MPVCRILQSETLIILIIPIGHIWLRVMSLLIRGKCNAHMQVAFIVINFKYEFTPYIIFIYAWLALSCLELQHCIIYTWLGCSSGSVCIDNISLHVINHESIEFSALRRVCSVTVPFVIPPLAPNTSDAFLLWAVLKTRFVGIFRARKGKRDLPWSVSL